LVSRGLLFYQDKGAYTLLSIMNEGMMMMIVKSCIK